tara:strand:+ start:158 stop:646 length:489 start_codon:yes stop_codon:yes gene_type:complete
MIRTFIATFILIFAAAVQPATASNCSKHAMTLAGQASNAGIFNTLLAAAEAANLTSVLYNDGPFTLFAPTDDAFAALPAGTVENLLKNPKELAKVLKYHLVKGNILSSDLNNGSSVSTVLGSPVSINTTEGVLINNAKVIQADVEASNGVIHVIDKVLLPTI